ncbi:acyltransferase domain-containing protein, partial [Streptomyces sp. NPDC058741]|uniref:acyltransferase domain-containing protein n=1 Tax=Streptomyces sp. NPDC058741 TaxID=3346620 RepID=UPI00369BBC01
MPVGDLARMLAGSRSVFEHRAAVTLTGTDRDTLMERLRAPDDTDGVIFGNGRPLGDPVWIFPGQGAQWTGMGVRLLDEGGAFAKRLTECAQALEPFIDWDLHAVLRGEPGQPGLDRVDVVQPALWAVMVSLAAQWHAIGARPAAVIGHSQGEIAAATVTGALTLTDGARIVALRSRLIAEHAGGGGMTSLALPRTTAQQTAEQFGLEVAAVNSPTNTVLSGPAHALDQLATWCDQHDIRCRRIPVDYASHSPFVDILQQQLLDLLAPITPRDSDIPLYSSLTTGPVHGSDLDAHYWFRNLRHTVEFEAATRAAAETGARAFIEISPHPVLTLPLQQTLQELDGPEPVVLGTLHRDHGDPHDFTHSAATAHTHGIPLRPTPTPIHPDLPTYPFQGTHHWLTPST